MSKNVGGLCYAKSIERLGSQMKDLQIGQTVHITYIQPFNGAGAPRWKVGEVTKVTDKWVLLTGHRGGWLPRQGILTVSKW
jgi:hypothetical protein